MKIIGLCGGSGSGKTTAARIMASLGAAVIDTDRVYREICVPGSRCISELCREFGDIVLDDGSLDRKKLGGIVFADAGKRARLNAIAHRHIKEETLARIALYRAEGRGVVVVDAPLLFEAEFDRFCDITVGIVAPSDVRLSRIMERDGISCAEAAARISSQTSDVELRARCDSIIENSSDRAEFRRRVRLFYLKAVFGGDRS